MLCAVRKTVRSAAEPASWACRGEREQDQGSQKLAGHALSRRREFRERSFEERHLLCCHARFLGGVGGKVGDERLNHGVAQVLSGADVVEMLARQNVEALLAPVLPDQEVGSELVAVPGGQDEATRQLLQEAREFGFIRFRPGVEVVNMPPCARHISSNP